MDNKLKMQSVNKVDENVKKISELFPNCVTEGKDENGKFIQVIDFDSLKQELVDYVVEGREERYKFSWPDKRNAMLLANQPTKNTLRPCIDDSIEFKSSENLYIEGDNLEVLKVLRETYLGKIKLIYIDPPYNTGNDFIYEDDFTVGADEYKAVSGEYDAAGNRLVRNTDANGRYHSDWLNMMYPRLKIAKDLLKEDGVIFISIDDNEVHNLRKVCDEIFGERNLVQQFPWQSRQSIQNDTDISSSHEYVVAYAKNRRRENRRLKEANVHKWFNGESFACLPLPLNSEKFSNPDEDVRGPWKADPFDAPNIRPNLTYMIKNPNTGEEYWPPKGRCWRTEEKTYQRLLKDNRIVFGKQGTSRPQLKVFYEEKKMFGSVDNTWWTAEKCGTSTQGTKELIKIFDGVSPFDTPKPTKLIEKIISLVSRPDSDDIILDFYSGSATTAHAVLNKNVLDGGNRKFILVQLNDPISTDKQAFEDGYRTICDIGRERINRVINNNIDRYQQEKVDFGYRVLRLDSSNMKDVYYNPSNYESTLFDDVLDNIKEDRKPIDLLFQVMLELGVLLSSKIDEEVIEGKNVFNVADGYLMACFDKDVSETTIEAVARKKPYYFVMRDFSLANDNVATNFNQIFEMYSPETIRKVL